MCGSDLLYSGRQVNRVILSMFLCAFLNRDVFPRSEQFFCKGYCTQLLFFDGQEEGHVPGRTAGSAGSVSSVTYWCQSGRRDAESSLGVSLIESWVPLSHLAAEPKLQHHHRAWQWWVTAAVRMV